MASSALALPVCPRCGVPPSLSEGQLARLQQAIVALPPGKSLSFACPGCRQPLSLSAARSTAAVTPPPPPPRDWLDDDNPQLRERDSEAPRALVLCQDAAQRRTIQEVLASLGYQARTADTVDEALEVMRFQAFGCLVLHTQFEGPGLNVSRVHETVVHLPMALRRPLFYILVGPGLATLYDLQALALSANLVVSEADLPHFTQVLRRAIPAHEALFGQLIEELGDRPGSR